MIFNQSANEDGKPSVLDYLGEQKFKSVLDIGGAMFPWAQKYVTHILDILNPIDYLKKYPEFYNDYLLKSKIFIGDINDNFGWEEVFNYIKKYGKFNFAICTQVLEDIRNPNYVLRILPEIAEEGYISVPNKNKELSLVEGCAPQDMAECGLYTPYIGYFHHRWICSILDGVFILFPKLQFVDCIDKYEWVNKEAWHELSFRWKGNIPFKIINDDWLGPNAPSVFEIYRKELKKGI